MSEDKSKESLIIKFNQYLEENKLRKTPERYFVLDVVCETSKKFDAEYLLNEVLSRGTRISRATVYNTLSALIEAQILREQSRAVGVLDGLPHDSSPLTLPACY